MLMKNIGYEKYNPPAGNWKKRTALSETRLPFASGNNVVYDDLPLRLLQSGNSISIFDMDERRAESYDSTGKLMMSANFRSDNDAYYSNRVLTDDNGRFYYCALKPEKNDGASAVTAISELNIKTGTHRQAMLLDAAAYSSLKISGGYLYYLKRENPKSDRFFLARTKLRE